MRHLASRRRFQPRKNGVFSYSLGILVSTASTYVLFVTFSLKASPEVLGLFALWSGAAAIILQFVDGISSQRIAQVHSELAALSPSGTGSVNFLNPGRLGVVLVAVTAVAAPAAFLDMWLAAGLAAMLVGQGAYSICVSTRVFDSSAKPLLTLQMLNCTVYCIVAAGVLILPMDFSPSLLLSLSGLASFVAAVPFLTSDFMARVKMDLSVRSEFRLLYLSDTGKHLGALAAYQAVNACGTAVDTLLTALGGLRTAAEYQVIRRPMLALSSLNVALGQQAINRYSRGSTGDWMKSLLLLSPVLVVWPGLGFAGLLIVGWMTPDQYHVSVLGGCLLALSFAVGAFLQITGTVVLVRKKTASLLFSALGRIVILILVALIAVPQLGVVGIGIALVIANVSLLGFHLCVLIASNGESMPERVLVTR